MVLVKGLLLPKELENFLRGPLNIGKRDYERGGTESPEIL